MHKLDPVLGIAALGQQVALNGTCPLLPGSGSIAFSKSRPGRTATVQRHAAADPRIFQISHHPSLTNAERIAESARRVGSLSPSLSWPIMCAKPLGGSAVIGNKELIGLTSTQSNGATAWTWP